jgi:flagellar hook-associated protein 3 FlgL
MRIDSMTYFNTSLVGIQSNQTAIARLNQQIATGLTMLATKDDPVTAVKAMELSNRIAVRTQYAANQDKAELDLNYETVVTKEMTSAINQARALLAGISPSHSASLRNAHAEQLKGVFINLLGLANERDPSGNYIFAGFETSTVPFNNTSIDTVPATVQPTIYSGTSAPGGVRNIEVESGRFVQANDNISDVFEFTDAAIVDPVNGGATHDVLENLADAIVNLPLGGVTDADLKGYMDVLDGALTNLGLKEHRVAGALTEIKELRASTQALLLTEMNALSDMTQVDQAAAIVELQSRQTTLEAISRAYSLTSGMSLFNYLG